VSDRPNAYSPSFEPHDEAEGFRCSRARLGRQAGSERLGASLYELPPGQTPWPYHFHLANEELMIVMSGEPSLRTPSGWRLLSEGEVVSFPAGEEGAHQVVNRSSAAVRVLIISEMNAPEVGLYPDSGKVGAFEVPPGRADDGLELFLPAEAAVDYWEGERAPGADGEQARAD
jgi:uncharacterized cupin superfamily protein